MARLDARKIWTGALQHWRRALRAIQSSFHRLSIAGLILCLFVGVLGIIASLKSGSPTASLADVGLHYLGILWKTLMGEAYEPQDRQVIELVTNGSIFALTILVALLSTTYLIQARRALEKSVKSKIPYAATEFEATTRQISSHALPIMQKFYENAETVRIMSGDYDWITESDTMADVISKLVQKSKATLQSYKPRATVENAWGPKAKEEPYASILNAIHYDVPGQFKASLITYPGGPEALVFLSQSDEDDNDTASGGARKYAIFEYKSRARSKTMIDMASFVFEVQLQRAGRRNRRQSK